MTKTHIWVAARGWRSVLAGLVLCLGWLATAPGASARPGGLDRSFGGTGIVTAPIHGGAAPEALVQQADGKLVAGGEGRGSFTLVRYHPDGTLDASFGGGKGIVATPRGVLNALVQQTDGKLVAAGQTQVGTLPEGAFEVARYNLDGTLDASFGGGTGTVITPFGSNDAVANALVLQPDGKLVAAGSSAGTSSSPGPSTFALVRYDTDGTLDPSFGGGTGIVTTPIAGGASGASALVQQADGKLVAAGSYNYFPDQQALALVRYNADGTLDPSFGNGTGTVMTPFGTSVAFAAALVEQPDGKLVAAGAIIIRASQWVFTLVRYNSDGTLDPSFGGGTGVVTTPIRGAARANALVLQPDGKLVAAGNSAPTFEFAGYGPSASKVTLVRYNADGSLDTSFGRGTGIVTRPTGAALALVEQPNGKLVAAVTTAIGRQERQIFDVVRYLNNRNAVRPE